MSDLFSAENVDLSILRERAYNYRWATLPPNCIGLTAADPDFPVAPEIREAIMDYTRSGYFSYGPAEGLPSFKASIAKVMQERKKITCSKDTILPTNSAAFGLFAVAKMLLEPNDEALIFDPVDFLFQKAVESAGGNTKKIKVEPLTGKVAFDGLKDVVSRKTKLLCLCNPLNPVGKVFTREELLKLGEFALENDLWILSDEIWSDIVFPPYKHISIASLSSAIAAKTFTVSGFSKTFGLAGLRVGFIVAPTLPLYQQLVRTAQVKSTAFGVSTLSQIAAQAAYEHCWEWVDEFLMHLYQTMDYTVDRLNNIDGIEINPPEGTYLVFPSLKSYGLSSEVMAERLLEKVNLAVIPGSPKFFGKGAEGHLRICFSTSFKMMKEGMDRLEEGVKYL